MPAARLFFDRRRQRNDPVCEARTFAPSHRRCVCANMPPQVRFPAAREASFHALQENTAGFWSYRTIRNSDSRRELSIRWFRPAVCIRT